MNLSTPQDYTDFCASYRNRNQRLAFRIKIIGILHLFDCYQASRAEEVQMPLSFPCSAYHVSFQVVFTMTEME